jgi:multisubunit Na+/H+ antiporter MnhC subunit
MTLLPWLVCLWLFGIGIYGMITSRNAVHLIGCLSVVQAGTQGRRFSMIIRQERRRWIR